MRVKAFLIVNDRGAVRAVKSFNHLSLDEIAIQVELNLPDELFYRPAVEVEIDVPADAVERPKVSAEMSENIKEAIQKTAGVEVRITTPPEDE